MQGGRSRLNAAPRVGRACPVEVGREVKGSVRTSATRQAMAASSPAVHIPVGSTWKTQARAFDEGTSSRNLTFRLRVGARAGHDSEGADREDSSLKISRRHAVLVLPVTTALAAAPRTATAAEEEIECTEGECGTVQLRTLSGCGLGVARYPDFVYNAEGGGGSGVARELSDGRTLLRFDPEKLKIPPVNSSTTTLLGLPLPPTLRIEIVPKTLEGYLERSTGKVELNFIANFNFTIGTLYGAPPLLVSTVLTTETVQGAIRGGMGKRLDSSGECQLVGVAEVAHVDDFFLNSFLTLPTDCLAELKAKIYVT